MNSPLVAKSSSKENCYIFCSKIFCRKKLLQIGISDLRLKIDKRDQTSMLDEVFLPFGQNRRRPLGWDLRFRIKDFLLKVSF